MRSDTCAKRDSRGAHAPSRAVSAPRAEQLQKISRRGRREPHARARMLPCEAAKLASDFDPQNRDENVDYYVAKLDELVKKFGGVTAAAPAPKQESLAL